MLHVDSSCVAIASLPSRVLRLAGADGVCFANGCAHRSETDVMRSLVALVLMDFVPQT